MVGDKYRLEQSFPQSDKEKKLRDLKGLLSPKIEEIQEGWKIWRIMDRIGLKRLDPLPSPEELYIEKEALQAFIRGCKEESVLNEALACIREIEMEDED